jgi:pimeloyl-ACP methyl ester carboxylesterase
VANSDHCDMSLHSPWVADTRLTPNVSQDAVVVIPGIMGSALRDTTTGQLLWGLRPDWYARAWASREALRALMLTDDERAGRIGRVAATGLLRFPAFSPVLAGFEPYTVLCDRIRTVVASPKAVLEFSYDWRLSVKYNASRLAAEAVEHLTRWRECPEHEAARRTRPDDRPAQLVLVAHSMGGLLCRALMLISGATDDVRATITLGTPFDGAAKAAVLLSSGHGAPLPRRRLRKLAATLPGLHDLLPMYRCVDGGDEVRRLTCTDIAALGGDIELARAAQEFHQRLAQVQLAGHSAVIGTEQPTVQSLLLRDGTVQELRHSFQLHTDGEFLRDDEGLLRRVDRGGDGTVPRNSANPVGAERMTVPQQHGPLATAGEAFSVVRSVIIDQDSDCGPRLGDGDIGLDLPDVVTPGTEWAVTVTGVAPHEATCTVTDLQTGLAIEHPRLRHRDGQVQAMVSLPEPGLFRIAVSGGGTTPVSQQVMAERPGGDPLDDDE